MVLTRAVFVASAGRLQRWVRIHGCERRRGTGSRFRTHIGKIEWAGRKRYAKLCREKVCLVGIKLWNPFLEDENRLVELELDNLLMSASLKLVSVSILLLARQSCLHAGPAAWVARIALDGDRT